MKKIEKVKRTHSHVLETYKSNLNDTLTFTSRLLSDESKIQVLCPRCSKQLMVTYKANEYGLVDAYCDNCGVKYNSGDSKFIEKSSESRFSTRRLQWVEKVEIFLSEGKILHIRPYIVTAIAKFNSKSNEYVVARKQHIYKMAFNLETGLSYLLDTVDGKGKTYCTSFMYDFAIFKRSKPSFPRILTTQADCIGVLNKVYPNISEIIKEILAQTPYFTNEDLLLSNSSKCADLAPFTRLATWNRLKSLQDFSREDFYTTFMNEHNFIHVVKENRSYISKILLKDKKGTLEKYINNVSKSTKSGKALKKLFYKNPLMIKHNRNLYKAGLTDPNIRLALLTSLEKIALLESWSPSFKRNSLAKSWDKVNEFVSFFVELLDFCPTSKVKSLIKQVIKLVEYFETLFLLEMDILKKKNVTGINIESFEIHSFSISSYRRTPVGRKYEDFNSTLQLYALEKEAIHNTSTLEEKKSEYEEALAKCFNEKNFYEIHEALSKLSSLRRDDTLKEPISYSNDDLKYEGVYKNYEFYLPRSPFEFNEIAKKFGNCVASYVGRVKKKKTLIVVARDKDTKDLKLCIELSGEKSTNTKGTTRCSFQYKRKFNQPPLEEDIEPLKKWYEKFSINNLHCFDAYWLDGHKAAERDAEELVGYGFEDEDLMLPF